MVTAVMEEAEVQEGDGEPSSSPPEQLAGSNGKVCRKSDWRKEKWIIR